MYSIYSTIGNVTVCLHDDLVADPRVKVIDPTLTLEDSSAGSLSFKLAPNNVGYGEYTVNDYVSSGVTIVSYTLTTSQPDDWLTDFRSYYTESGGVYSQVTPKSAPTWVAGTYYFKSYVNGHWEYVESDHEPANWSSVDVWTQYYTKSGNVYTQLQAAPTWAINTYYSQVIEDGVKNVPRLVNLVERMAAIITVYRTNQNGEKTEIWQGRVLSETNDFNNLREIYCEGEMAFLNDTIQPQKDYPQSTLRTFIDGILKIHNSKVDDSKKFETGAFVVTGDAQQMDDRRTDYGSTWDALKSIIDKYQVHVFIRKKDGVRYLDCYSDYPRTSTQEIRLGHNLLDFTRSWNMANLATAVMPTGKMTESATSSSVGDELTPTSSSSYRIMWLDDDHGNTVKIRKTDVKAYKVNTYTLEADKNYYLSSRLGNGYVWYSVYTSGGVQHSYKTAGRDGEEGLDDHVDEKFTVPHSEIGSNYTLKLCSWGSDIPPKVKAEIPATEGFDKYLTVVGANVITSMVLTTSQPEDWYSNYKSYYTALYTHVTGGSAPQFQKGTYYDRSDTIGYFLLDEEPSDWSTNYTHYYVKVDNGYSPVTGATPPVWKSNTYYRNSTWHTKNSPYIINQAAVTKYGWIEKHLEFPDIDDINNLAAAGKNYLESGQFDEMQIEISAIDLSSIGVDYEAIRLLDYVRVVSEPHGLDKLFPVTKLEIPLSDPANQQFTLGYTSTTENISAASMEAVATINDWINGQPSISNILLAAQENASQLIDGSNTPSYIEFIKDQSDHTKINEIIIMDAQSEEAATRMWRWNAAGLGFKKKENGTWTNYTLAMTMDGAIVADFITSGGMYADRINGGTLTLGGVVNSGTHMPEHGRAVIKDATGNDVCIIDNNGVTTLSFASSSATTGDYTQLLNGRTYCGTVTRDTSTTPTTYTYTETGRTDGNIHIGNEWGMSFEANRHGTGANASCSGGIISMCTEKIFITTASNNQNPYGPTETYSGRVTLAIGSKLEITTETDPDTGTTETKLVLKGHNCDFEKGFLMTVGQEEVISEVTLSTSS